MAQQKITGYMYQKSSLYSVDSRYDGTEVDSNAFFSDSYNNKTRAKIQNMNSSGLGVGGAIATTVSGNAIIECKGGEIQLNAVSGKSGSQIGYVCSLLDVNACPVIGGIYAIGGAQLAEPGGTSQPVPADKAIVACQYPVEALKTTQAINTWVAAFESSVDVELNEKNRKTRWDSGIMIDYCAAVSKHCKPGAEQKYKGEELATCARFNATGRNDGSAHSADDGGIECSRWAQVVFGDPDSASRASDVAVSMSKYCSKNIENDSDINPECWCHDRTKDQNYKDMASALGSTNNKIPIPDGCFWLPCTLAYDEQLRKPEDDCPPETNYTLCFEAIYNYGNIGGDLEADWVGQIDCGDQVEDPDDGPRPPGGGGGGLEAVVWSDVATWPWWIWLIIAIGGLLVIVLLFFLFKPKSKSETVDSTPALPYAPYQNAYEYT